MEETTQEMKAPRARRTRQSGISTTKALSIVVVAAVLGVLVVRLGAQTKGGPTVAEPPFMIAPAHHHTNFFGVKPSASVKVLVADGANTPTATTKVAKVLSDAGWGVMPDVLATTTLKLTYLYYATGQKASAKAVAQTLGIPLSRLKPISSATPVSVTTGADVVVVIGRDQVSLVTTTTAASGATTTPSTTSTTIKKTTKHKKKG